jgi:hypothetical protein
MRGTTTDCNVDPALYLAMLTTSAINNALVSLLLLAILTTVYDMFLRYLRRRTRSRQTRNYSIIDGGSTPDISRPGLLSSFARTSHGSPSSVYAKAFFHTVLFVMEQYTMTQLVIHVARFIASTTITSNSVRDRCSRLWVRGLECPAALQYHDILNVAAVVGLLCFIRSFATQLENPSPYPDPRSSPGFRTLWSGYWHAMQSVFAVPITIVNLHTLSRGDLWRRARLVLVQGGVSLGLFLIGNFVCFVAVLPVWKLTPCMRNWETC